MTEEASEGGAQLPPHVIRLAQLREGGAMRRHSALPVTAGSYTHATRSWNMMVLATMTHPSVSGRLLMALMYDQIEDRWLGEMADVGSVFPVEVSKAVARTRRQVRSNLTIAFDGQLTDEDHRWIRSLRRLETLVLAREQVAMGNMNWVGIGKDALNWIRDKSNDVPDEVRVFAEQHRWCRTTGDQK